MATETTQDIPVTTESKAAKTTAMAPARPAGQMDQLLRRFLGRSWPMPFLFGSPAWSDFFEGFDELEARVPSLDVIDRDEEIFIRAEVPGLDKKDLDLSLTDNVLSLRGQTRREEKEEKGDYHRREISTSAFSRSVTLPAAVDASKAQASLKDGILEITLPKVEASRRRNIAVQ